MISFVQILLRPTGLIRNGRVTLVASNQIMRYSSKDTSDNVNQEAYVEDEKQYVDDIKTKILDASLEFVNESGWTKATLGKGAQSMGYASTLHSIFPHGPAHLVHHFTVSCNKQLAAQMENKVSSLPNGVTNPISFIEDSIISRIDMLLPYKNNWSQGLATIVNSRLALDQAASLMTLADDICYFAGDRSIDSTWYARRAVVGAIYQASELHWLGGGKQTREFTASQLLVASNLEAVPKNISALLTIARNILPLNLNR